MDRNDVTFVDQGGTRYYRHRPEPVRSFEARISIPGRCDALVLSTPDGVHEVEIVLLAHRNGRMQPVLHLRGMAAPDGQLQVVVTDELSGKVLRSKVDAAPAD